MQLHITHTGQFCSNSTQTSLTQPASICCLIAQQMRIMVPPVASYFIYNTDKYQIGCYVLTDHEESAS